MKIDLSQRRVDLDGFLGGESDSSLTIWIQVVLGCGQVRIGAFLCRTTVRSSDSYMKFIRTDFANGWLKIPLLIQVDVLMPLYNLTDVQENVCYPTESQK